jgi:SAM-dependent methyltransferase
VPCNLCGADAFSVVRIHRGYRFVRCRRCGLAYLNPRPTPEALVAAYADYHGRGGGSEASWGRLMGGVFREAADLLACGVGPETSRPRLLDVGCGFGTFVDLMRERGWEAEGLDPSQAVVEAARRRGVAVRLGTLEALPAAPAAYDAITAFYVLEHLADPLAALRKIHGLLVPGGTLVIRVPHTTPVVRLLAPLGVGGGLYDAPFHLFDFSPAVLRAMLNQAGFAEIRTFPGRATAPARLPARLASAGFGALARALFAASRGRVLLPGVSKTTVARKPAH